jgi:hypothetical protein
MPSPRELQQLFRDAVTGTPSAALLGEITGGLLGPDRRLAIYRNHYFVTLVDALAATYPAVQSLVGERFFRAAARRFVATEPPRSPRLDEYGAGFAAFLAAREECADLPYLADVARFEWAINCAYHAPDAAPMAPAKLAAVTPAQCAALAFRFHPSVALVHSRYPVVQIWLASQPDAEEIVDLAAGGVRLLVRRSDLDVVWRALSPQEFAFVAALAGGRTVGEAYVAGCERQLAALIAEGAIVDFHVRATPTS